MLTAGRSHATRIISSCCSLKDGAPVVVLVALRIAIVIFAHTYCTCMIFL